MRWPWAIAATTMVLGAITLRLTFAVGDGEDSSTAAFVLSSLALAGIWAVGGCGVIAAHGPDRGTRSLPRRRAALEALGIGAGFAAASLLGALTLLALPWTHAWVADALTTAHAAPQLVVLLVALLAGAGEEVFFRLALPRLLTGWSRYLPVLLYAVATAATGNIGLVLVAVPLGALATFVWNRTGRWTGPLIVHAVWSLVMVGLLPLIVP